MHPLLAAALAHHTQTETLRRARRGALVARVTRL
jgi:hypothetical protein